MFNPSSSSTISRWCSTTTTDVKFFCSTKRVKMNKICEASAWENSKTAEIRTAHYACCCSHHTVAAVIVCLFKLAYLLYSGNGNHETKEWIGSDFWAFFSLLLKIMQQQHHQLKDVKRKSSMNFTSHPF